jgi:hypothetical protein
LQTTHPLLIPARLQNLASLALLLEKLERRPRQASAEQYRAVVAQLSALLAQATLDGPLNEVLNAFPATAELYENLQYGHAGLCRHGLEPSLAAEQEARALLSHVQNRR